MHLPARSRLARHVQLAGELRESRRGLLRVRERLVESARVSFESAHVWLESARV